MPAVQQLTLLAREHVGNRRQPRQQDRKAPRQAPGPMAAILKQLEKAPRHVLLQAIKEALAKPSFRQRRFR